MPKLWPALLLTAAVMSAQTPNANPMNQGVAALQAGKYDEAVRFLQQAVNASPSDPAPHLHLATAYMQQYMPGLDNVQNDQFAIDAERELQNVMVMQPGNLQAMESLASLKFNQASGKRDLQE